MALTLCNGRLGGNDVIQAEPATTEWHDVVYLPAGMPAGCNGGLYDRSGQLLPHSGYYRGPDRQLVAQVASVPVDTWAAAEAAPDDTYIFGGALQTHYGHFLLGTLARFWHLRPGRRPPGKIVMQAPIQLAAWFEMPHIAFLFGRLGLTTADFVQWDRPMRLHSVVVPEASFEELSSAHQAFASLGNAVGNGVASTGWAHRNSTPVYLCKSRLRSGVWRIRNEMELADTLARRGVDVVFPEELSLSDQIGLYQTRETVLGTVSSGFHTSIFASEAATIVGLNHDAVIVSNYTLIDAVNGNTSHYYHPQGAITAAGSDGAFSLNFDLMSPGDTAGDLLRAAEAAGRGKRGARRGQQTAISLDALGLRYGTDRNSANTDLLRVYQPVLEEIARKPDARVLELGCGAGGSLAMFAQFFRTGHVTGFDIDAAARRQATDDAAVIVGDQSDTLDLHALAMQRGPFDLILDDGSHQWDHQITSLRALYPFLNPGGAYIVEHVETSFGELASTFRGDGDISAMTYLQMLSNAVVASPVLPGSCRRDAFIKSIAASVASVSFHPRSCIIRRKSG